MPDPYSPVASETPLVVDSIEEARRLVRAARTAGKRIGLVPTMGSLHEGHLSLLDAARDACDFIAATIFVNPTQFGPHEDLAKYPRPLGDDLVQLANRRVDLVFTPSDQQMYPPGYSTYVTPPQVAQPWEGVVRPGHFRGVATVVLKLFQIVPADIAFFGQKDYQQTCVIRRMVMDLNLPIEIDVRPTIRDTDGLALSSRNQYLTRDERARAIGLYQSLKRGVELIGAGEQRPEVVQRSMREQLEQHAIREIDYVGIADPETLQPLVNLRPPIVLLVAARLGTTRLIDNWLIPDTVSPDSASTPPGL
jgi:pantoate--beta-alanine ligase